MPCVDNLADEKFYAFNEVSSMKLLETTVHRLTKLLLNHCQLPWSFIILIPLNNVSLPYNEETQKIRESIHNKCVYVICVKFSQISLTVFPCHCENMNAIFCFCDNVHTKCVRKDTRLLFRVTWIQSLRGLGIEFSVHRSKS